MRLYRIWPNVTNDTMVEEWLSVKRSIVKTANSYQKGEWKSEGTFLSASVTDQSDSEGNGNDTGSDREEEEAVVLLVSTIRRSKRLNPS